jgi:TIR domain
LTLEFRRNGSKVSESGFFDGMMDDALEEVMTSYAEELHGKASSIVDPETGKHIPVFVRRIGHEGWSIHTNGSQEFARALERRLGLNVGEVNPVNAPNNPKRLVYLAHASEDKPVVKPLAEGLIKNGIDVWYDNWEIGYGDSLRRKMEQGLGECSHFVVFLTKTSIAKPWVNEEIDAGLLKGVEGTAKFIGLRYNLPLGSVSTFLKTRLTPEYHSNDEGLKNLVAEIYGVSRKPPLGEAPRYVQIHKTGDTWAISAKVVAEYFVRNSEHANSMDPIASYDDIQSATGLPMPDVRIGVLDLVGSGLIEKSESVNESSRIWARPELFATFDADYMDWDPEEDAKALASELLNLNLSRVRCAEAAQRLDWPTRRFNSAVAYLIGARVVELVEYLDGSDFLAPALSVGDELLRYVRSL